MNLFSIIFIGMVALLAIVTVFYFILAISRNFIDGQQMRTNLGKRLKMLRINKMLQKRKINVNKYLHEIPIHEIEKQIRNCESCQETAVCDEVLLPNNKLKTNYSFCPNTRTFNKLSENKM